MQRTTFFLALVLSTSACSSAATMGDDTLQVGPATTTAALQAAINAPDRSADNRARDGYRHPLQTLAFFGVKPNHTVIEITPGGGWYSEILAPYLNAGGHYLAAVPTAAAESAGAKRTIAFRDKLAGNAATSGAAVVEFDGKAPTFAAGTNADAVLTFRNVHNWVAANNADAYFRAFFAALKPGGILGVVDHRAKPGTDLDTMKSSGYLTEALVNKFATDAGFVLDASSEINANPKDGASHPNGVWTLPPVNRHEAADDASYKAIGESDRMTLRFRKPG